MTEQTMLLETLLPVIWPLIATVGGMFGIWTILKNRITQVRNFVVTLDDALKDDKITADEVKQIVDSFSKIIQKSS